MAEEEHKFNSRIVSFVSRKGGVGKSTLLQNLAVYMAKQPQVHKILLIDLDSQMNLTSNYEKNISKQALNNSNIYREYQHDAYNPRAPYPKNFKPAKVGPKTWLFSGSAFMDNIFTLLDSHDKQLELYALLHMFGMLDLIHKFDYILIDCHGDFSLATKEAVVCSNKVIIPVTPSRYSFQSTQFLQSSINKLRNKAIDFKTNESFVNCQLLFVGNMVKWNTNSSREFMEYINNNNNFKAAFPFREVFNRATVNYTDIFNLANNIESGAKSRKDIDTINNQIKPQFKKLMKAINN